MTREGRAWVAFAIALALQTAASVLPPWVPAPGPVWRPPPAPAASDGRWVEVSAGGGTVRCPADLPVCRAEASWEVPPRPGAVLARAVASRAGRGPRARLVLVDAGGRHPGAIDVDPGRVEAVAPGRPPVRLALTATGEGEVVSLEGLEVRDAARSPLRVGVLTGWWVATGALAAELLAAIAAAPRRARRALSALVPLGLVGIAMPSAWLDRILLAFPGARPEDLGKDPLSEPTVVVFVQKGLGHGLGFAALGVVLALARAGALRTALVLSAAAVFTETLQTLLPDRSGKLSDVGVDLAGGLLGAALAVTLRAAAPRAPRPSAASRP